MAGRPSKKNEIKDTPINETSTTFNNVVEEVSTTIADTSEPVEKQLNMDEKITIRSLAAWMTGFNRRESIGEVNLQPYGVIRLTRAEVIAQFENGNKLICGDGTGKHATIFIDDKATRDYLGITSSEINFDFIKEMFEINDMNTFKSRLKSDFVTRAEKGTLIDAIRKNIKSSAFNDFSKVRECENHCGMKI